MNNRKKLQEILNQIETCDKKYNHRFDVLATKYKQDRAAISTQKEEEKKPLIQKMNYELNKLVIPSTQVFFDIFLKDKILQSSKNHKKLNVVFWNRNWEISYDNGIHNNEKLSKKHRFKFYKAKEVGIRDSGDMGEADFSYGKIYLVDNWNQFRDIKNMILISYVPMSERVDSNPLRENVLQITSEQNLSQTSHHQAILNGVNIMGTQSCGLAEMLEIIDLLKTM